MAPGEFGFSNAICPRGWYVVGGGTQVIGPGIVLRSGSDGLKDSWTAEIYNATDALSDGTETARLAATAMCARGTGGLRIRSRGIG
ncbi:hypothetical protein [Capillimicrobium parvum]|uniref:hypothetical protein n=1 Tax=Capillimicrobium parvum TaxID=2884022 RepID=UPI00216B13E1|nr:hypothetical protein [Capillimicrobium parvum]